MKRDPKKTYRNKADIEWQKLIVRLHPNCESCGRPSSTGHHFILKSQSNALRYDEANGIGICVDCHCKHHKAGDPIVNHNIIKSRGEDWFKYIMECKKKTVKTSLSFYEIYYHKLKEMNEEQI